MRRILFLLTALAALFTSAQTHYEGTLAVGGKAGMSLSRVNFNPTVQQAMLPGMTAGAHSFLICAFIRTTGGRGSPACSSEKLRTIQVGIRYFTNQFSTDYVSMYAAIMISIIPSIIGYILFQEQIIAGMTSGAVKG